MTDGGPLSLNRVNQFYFNKLFVEKNNTALSAPSSGKVLLVDNYTMPTVAMSFTQTQLLQNDVILVEILGGHNKPPAMKHLHCVVYVLPCRESIAFLCEELRLPHYGHYQLFFSNTVAKNVLEKIAAADEHEVVNQVVELFHEYCVVNDNMFCAAMLGMVGSAAVEVSGHVISLLLSLRKCPVIKYDASSLELKRLASEVLYGINTNTNNNLFEDVALQPPDAPILLIVDRKFDPITPLVTPWTYQSMIHELIGIDRNIVKLPETNEQLILSEEQDAFYQEAMYLNYGDLTDRFQKYVDDYKKQTKQSSIQNLKTQDLSELKRILTRFPEFKKLSNNILKHLNIISEIDKQISAKNLWVVGELQQTIVCGLENHQTIRAKLLELVADASFSCECKITLLLLYISKYPQNTADYNALIGNLQDPLKTNPPPNEMQITLLRNFRRVLRHSLETPAGTTTPANNNIGQLFSQNRIKIQQLFNSNDHTRNGPKNDNIYMQYVPKLEAVLHRLISPPESQSQAPGGLKLATMVPDVLGGDTAGDIGAARDIIVYFNGGISYEEARIARKISANNPGVSVVVGSDCILNSSLWLQRLCALARSGLETAVQPDRKAQLRDIL